jgi:DUF971 family protein
MQNNRATLGPTDVAVDKIQKQVRISWGDGHKGIYSFEQLRTACPCAECRTYRADDNPFRHALIVSTEPESAQLVGNYGIQFTRDDGHRFGIYSWELLRSLG